MTAHHLHQQAIRPPAPAGFGPDLSCELAVLQTAFQKFTGSKSDAPFTQHGHSTHPAHVQLCDAAVCISDSAWEHSKGTVAELEKDWQGRGLSG